MADFRGSPVLEPALEAGERGRHIELGRRARVGMRKRKISRAPRLGREGNAHELRLQRFYAGRLDSKRDERRCCDACEPVFELLWRQYRFVVAFVGSNSGGWGLR